MTAYVVVRPLGTMDPGTVVSFSDDDRALGVQPEGLLRKGVLRLALPEDGDPVPYRHPSLPRGPDGTPYATIPHVLSEWEQAVLAARAVLSTPLDTPAPRARKRAAKKAKTKSQGTDEI